MSTPPPNPTFMTLINALDHEGIEGARGVVRTEDVPALAAWYPGLDWPQKLALVDLICDQNHPSMEAVLIDALRAPGMGDWVDLPKAFALGWLDGELDNFMGYYNDRHLLRRTADAFLAKRGLRREPEPPTEPSTPVVETPKDPAKRLIVAVRHGQNHEVLRLLAQGVPPDTRDEGEHGDPALCEALMKKNFEAAMLLVEAGADANVRRWTANQSALWWAAAQGALDVVDALLSRGAAVDAKDGHGSTPLTVACTSGHIEVARRLLAAGASVHNQISDKRTVLILSVRGGKAEILNVLLDAGADLQSCQPNFTPLAFACFEGNAAMVKLLVGRGAKPDARFTGAGFDRATALMVAARAGNVRMVEHLLGAGAEPGLKDGKGRTAAELAKGRRADSVRDLLARG